MIPFEAFLLKNGNIFNYGKTQIGQLTHEGSMLAQQKKKSGLFKNGVDFFRVRINTSPNISII